MGNMDDMGGMGGMDMGSTGLFQTENKNIARALWYIVAATAIVRGCGYVIDYLRTKYAKRQHSLRSSIPSRPTNLLSQTYDTVLATLREISYPACRPFHGRILRSLTPPPLGRSLLILTYWAIILIMLFSNVFLAPTSSLYGYRWEKPAFRAAWVSMTQVPLLFALSCKFNIISIVTGVSYERLNWLHRWVSRTLFMTVIVHWAYFFHEWSLADFVKFQLKMMPMVKYGFGAWAVIGWMVITGFGFFRDLCYELWLLQHLAGAGTLLWLLYVHVPNYAKYNIWLAVAFVAFDRGFRGIWSLATNLHMRSFGKGGIGFRADASALPNGYLKLAVKNVDFSWRAGQHVFLSIPACGIFESHPFTVSNNSLEARSSTSAGGKKDTRDLEVYFKCHSGFTKRLQKRAQALQANGSNALPTHRVFLSGPWGTPPIAPIERSNALIFIASSTGASYTLPLLEHAIAKAPFVQQVCFYWTVRHTSQISWFDVRLRAAVRHLASLGLKRVSFRIFLTGLHDENEIKMINLPADTASEIRSCELQSHGLPFPGEAHGDARLTFNASSDDVDRADHENEGSEKALFIQNGRTSPLSLSLSSSSSSTSSKHSCDMKACRSKSAISSPSFTHSLGRPRSLDNLIRPTVEAAQGETVIVACGGTGLMADIRNYVATLSDERAVHKGTGAQGIYLWTESYGW